MNYTICAVIINFSNKMQTHGQGHGSRSVGTLKPRALLRFIVAFLAGLFTVAFVPDTVEAKNATDVTNALDAAQAALVALRGRLAR